MFRHAQVQACRVRQMVGRALSCVLVAELRFGLLSMCSRNGFCDRLSSATTVGRLHHSISCIKLGTTSSCRAVLHVPTVNPCHALSHNFRHASSQCGRCMASQLAAQPCGGVTCDVRVVDALQGASSPPSHPPVGCCGSQNTAGRQAIWNHRICLYLCCFPHYHSERQCFKKSAPDLAPYLRR